MNAISNESDLKNLAIKICFIIEYDENIHNTFDILQALLTIYKTLKDNHVG